MNTSDIDAPMYDSGFGSPQEKSIQQQRWETLEVIAVRAREELTALGADADSDTSAWSSDMREMRGIAVSHRGLVEVAHEHGMLPAEFCERLRDKRILIVGPGKTSLGHELIDAGVSMEQTSVDIDEEALNTQPGIRILGSATKLELPSKTFDVVLLTFSLPLWAFSPGEALAALDEALRVTAEGGVVMVAPIATTIIRSPISRNTGRVLGQFANGFVREPDPRFRAVQLQIDLATCEWLKRVSATPGFEVTLHAYWDREQEGSEISGVIIRRV